MVRRPNPKAKSKPTSPFPEKWIALKLSSIFPPKTIGRLIKKLSFKETVLSNFLSSKAATVNPERDNPGKAANPWTIPKTMASLRVKSSGVLTPLFFLFNSRPAVINNKIPTPIGIHFEADDH